MKNIFMKIVILLIMVMLPFQAQGYVHPNQAGHKGGDTIHAGSGDQVVTTTYFGNTGDLLEQGVMFSVDKDGQNASSFHGFKGYPTDASFPWYTTPMQASDGALYGVGFIGGSNNLGATYKYDMSSCSEEIIANNGLVPGSNQDSPGNYANINELSDGKIYRADTYGGKFGLGAIISMDKDGSNVQVIHNFTYASTQVEDINNSQFVQAVRDHLIAQGLYINPDVSYDGGYPYGFVVEGSDGRIYGSTLMGGYFTGGTVYSMNKDGSDYKILYMGDGYVRYNYYKDGTGTILDSAISSYYMWGNVAEGSDGNIYFTGYVGGVNNLGAVSRIHKDGTNYQILHSASLAEGSTPYRGPLIIDNKVYQTYFTGGNGQGTISSMNYDGSAYNILYNFPADGSEGGQPRGGLAYDGEYLYGTTIIYGGVNTVGTLYKVKPNDGSTFQTIHRFSNVAEKSCGGKPGLFNWFPSSERVTFANVSYNCSKTCITDANYSLCGNGYVDKNISVNINPNAIPIGNIIDQVNNTWGVGDTHLVKDNGQWYVFDTGAGLLHLNKIDPITGNTVAVGNVVDQVNNTWGDEFEVFNYNNQWYVLDVAAGLAHLNKIDLATGNTVAVGNLVDQVNNVWGANDVKVFEDNGEVYVMDLGAGLLHLNKLNPETGATTAVGALTDKIDNVWGYKFEVFQYNNQWYIFDVSGGATGASLHTFDPTTGTTTAVGQLTDLENNYWGVDDINIVESNGKWFILDAQAGLLHVNEFNPATATTIASANMIDGVNNIWGVEFDTFVENNRLYIFDVGAGLGHLNVLELNGNATTIRNETCDDGNTIDGDGCSSTCQLEVVCGNGILELGEACDDNNTINGDGCSATCLIENGHGNCNEDAQCTTGNCNTTTHKCETLCGNGILEAGEACDDNNTVNGDGCSATCLIENGRGTCNTNADCASNKCNTTTHKCETLCGNGVLESGEACDDNNTINGDGCSDSCLIEDGQTGCTINADCVSHNCNATTHECNPLASCTNGVVRSIDFAQIDSLSATPDNNVTQTINVAGLGDVKIDLSAAIGTVTAYATGGTFADRAPNGDESGIVLNLNSADLSTQKNTITITFPKPVTNVAFTYTDIDGGSGISDEKTTFSASNAGTSVPLLSSYVTLEANGPLPKQQGDALVGVTGTGNANVLRVIYTAPIDKLVIDMSLSSNDLNEEAIQRMFDISLCDVPVAAVCGNGIVETGEECDDNNTVSGDGCSDICKIENAATIPDYSIAVYLNKTTIIDYPTPVFILVTISELKHASNTGDLVFSLTKNPNLSINFSETLVELGGMLLKNSEWEKITETATNYQFRYKANNGIYPNFTRMRVGLTGIYTPPVHTRGKFILNARIKGQNGETNFDNNKDSETLIFSKLPDGN